MKNAGVWLGLILLIFGGIFLWYSLSYDYYGDYGPGPGLFPVWLSGLLILLAILYIIDSIRKEPIDLSELLPRGKGLRKVLAIFASMVIFLILLPFTGFTVACVIMLFILFYREYKWYWGLGISIVISFALFYAFYVLLSVPLPVNSFGL